MPNQSSSQPDASLFSTEPKPAPKRRARRSKKEFRDPRLFRRGRVIWCNVLDPEGTNKIVRLSTKCRDEAAATAQANEYERLATHPRDRAAKATTLEDAINDLQINMRQKGKSQKTIEAAVSRLGHFVRLYGKDMPLARMSAKLVSSYIDTRRSEPSQRIKGNTVARSTLGYELGALRMLLKRALILGNFTLPVEAIVDDGYGEQASAVERFPTIDQAWAIIKALPPRVGAVVAYYCATGCRASEAERALEEHVKRTFIHIEGTKTKHCRTKAREIPRTPICEPFLAYALQHAGDPGRRRKDVVLGERLFSVGQDSVRERLRELHKERGFPLFSANDFRRAVCQWHLADGYSEEFCALLLRHKDVSMVRAVYGQHNKKGEALKERMLMEQKAIASGMRLVPNLYAKDQTSEVQPDQAETIAHEKSQLIETNVA